MRLAARLTQYFGHKMLKAWTRTGAVRGRFCGGEVWLCGIVSVKIVWVWGERERVQAKEIL